MLLLLTSIFAHAEDAAKGAFTQGDWTRLWTHFHPNAVEYPEPTITLKGEISSDMVLSNRQIYLLEGRVYVTNNATLTIEPGTIIRGDKLTKGTLIITQGAKIMAEGTETNPIVFTSNQIAGNRMPGDWGGIIVLGKAPISRIGGKAVFEGNFEQRHTIFGGNDKEDNSGILRYVRIEYPGEKITKTKELNGLSLAGVGSKTTLEYVQVSYSNDDAFEMYGGNLDASHLLSFKCGDDDFDFTMGFQGTLSYICAIRHPFISDFSGSRSVEINTYSKPETYSPDMPLTNVNIHHATFVTIEKSKMNQSAIREAVYLGDNATVNISKSIISDFNYGICLESKKGQEAILNKESAFHDNLVANALHLAVFEEEIEKGGKWMERVEYHNTVVQLSPETLFQDINNKKHYNLTTVQRETLEGSRFSNR